MTPRARAVPAAVRAGRCAAAVARRLFASAVDRLGPLEVIGPTRSGRSAPGTGAPRMTIAPRQLLRPRSPPTARSASARPTWPASGHADDLVGVLTAFAAQLSHLVPPPLQRLRASASAAAAAASDNTPAGSRANISRHYDLSNDLFALFLDETMTYSCAVFEAGDEPLADAPSAASTTPICDLAGVGAGMHVLEIGTGWGGMAMHAAASAAAGSPPSTLSTEQRDAGRAARRATAGLERPGRRPAAATTAQLAGSYDAIVSIEMFEAVGEEYWPDVLRRLRPAARAGRAGRRCRRSRCRTTGYRATRRSYTLDPQVHLPGRADPVGAGDRRRARARLARCG